jgi:hypothetical protein
LHPVESAGSHGGAALVIASASILDFHLIIMSPKTPDSEIYSQHAGQKQYQAAYAEEPGAPYRQRVKSFDDKQETENDPKDCKNIPAHFSFPLYRCLIPPDRV